MSTPMKTDYYELLGVDKTATQKDVERGYKRSALRWHPDKNPDQDTTKMFQDILEAYNVLSDPNERAWYDDHKDQILRGKNTDDLKEEDFDYLTKSKLMEYFSNSCYSGFNSKAEDNFYRVYAQLFRTLDKEEEMEEEVGEEHSALPDFGDADSTADDVFKFYSSWQYFSTSKKFSYADKYNPSQAPNRRIKRLIETENKKERQVERKEFNDTVMKLVEYVQKRDPRYQKFKMAEQREKEAKRLKEEDERNKKRAEEQEKLRKYREEIAQRYAQEEEEALANGDIEEVMVEEFRCEVCKKVFKNEKQMENHTQSKKHKDNYARFKETVELDDETEQVVKQEEEKKQSEIEEEQRKLREERLKEIESQQKKKTCKAKKNESDDEEVKGAEEEEQTVFKEEEEEEQYISKNKLKKMKEKEQTAAKNTKKQGKNVISSGTTIKEQFKKLDKQEQDELYELIKQKETKQKSTAQQMQGPQKTKGKKKHDESDDDEKPVEKIQPKQPKKKNQPNDDQKPTKQEDKEEIKEVNEPAVTIELTEIEKPQVQQQAEEEEEFTELGDDGDKVSKKDKRRQKKTQKEQDSNQISLKCNICKEQFDTRNALFTHIKKTGHARAA